MTGNPASAARNPAGQHSSDTGNTGSSFGHHRDGDVEADMVAAQNIGHADASDQKQWTLMWREDGGLMPSRAVPDAALLAADSWLVDDGRVRGLDRHRRRFVAACVEASGDSPARIESFWRDAIAALPRTERWFPRVELAGPEPAGCSCGYARRRRGRSM
ncbi:hypothetical protein GCM10017744_014710 [Streptomyces antimycoticus]